MRFGEIELFNVGNKQVAAVWNGIHIQPESLVECELGTLTAAEYVALFAARSGRFNASVALFCTHMPLPGEVEHVQGERIH